MATTNRDGMDGELVERAWQQVPFDEVRRDQRVDVSARRRLSAVRRVVRLDLGIQLVLPVT